MTTDTSTTVRGRLAPSPTGALHLGNARTFLIAWLSARSQGGQVVLRMEDLDHPKVKPETVAQAVEDLHWLGLNWDEGLDNGGPHEPYIQSRRTHLYRDALAKLQKKNLVYPCTCTRKDVEAAQSAPHHDDYMSYPGICRGKYKDFEEANIVSGENRLPAWRFIVPDRIVEFVDGFHGRQSINVHNQAGDFVLARHRDGAGYQLAVVIDDAIMGITEIVRGDDLLSCTPWQILLYEALELPVPRFIHVPLVKGPDGRRLAKRHGDTRISHFRDAGIVPAKVAGLLAWSCGWAEFGEQITPHELIARFNLRTIPAAPFVVDAEIIDALNR